MRAIVYILALNLLFASMNAQEKALLYSHSSFSGLAINPAYTGSHEMLSATLSHRSQWIGFEGAPSYNMVAIHTPYKNTPTALGLLVMNESMGLRRYTGIYLNYAYRMTFGKGKLALGLKGGIGTGKIDPVDLGDDLVFSENARSFLLPNFGLGIYYYAQKFHAGVSIPLLMGYKANESGAIISSHDFNNYAYYLTAGYKMNIAENWNIEPSVLAEYERATGMIADAGLGFYYKDFLHLGASYRSEKAIVVLMDFKLNYQLRIGVAYDYGMSEINEYNRSSFEAGLEYNFGYRIKAADPTVF